MKIDWKYIATTPGYKSLKAAYIKDVMGNQRYERPMRNKAEFLRHFKWVIGRALHYAHIFGLPLDFILDSWEDNRTYWWLNYYQESRQPKQYTYCRYTGKKKSVS